MASITQIEEGYIYNVYGDVKYLKDAVASAVTIRRHDKKRGMALVCEPHHEEELKRVGLTHLFDVIEYIKPEHRSIVGFKHHVYQYLLFKRSLFLDTDMVMCKNPDPMWKMFSAYPFTITGKRIADNFFGASKGVGVIWDILFQRRRRTMKRVGVTHFSRIQSGMIYAEDAMLTQLVCETATDLINHKELTHFKSRTLEAGRSEESCEWSFGLAMAKMNLPVFPWLIAHHSPQLDYFALHTQHDPDFKKVTYKYYMHPFMYGLMAIPQAWLWKLISTVYALIPGYLDHAYVTPYMLHFGWMREKGPFRAFSERTWQNLIQSK